MSDPWHLYSKCPRCDSEVRHRLLLQTLNSHPNLNFSSLLENKDILHFTPEPVLRELIKSKAKTYLTSDYLKSGFDLKLDIANMPTMADQSFDLVIACDVLEHIPDDKAALTEIFRILRPGGFVILTVPQQDDLEKTFEDSSITSPEERTKIFGQFDHLRIYGSDFISKLQQVNFQITVIDESNFSESETAYYVLFPPVLSTNPLATNYRKIFFARKPLSSNNE